MVAAANRIGERVNRVDAYGEKLAPPLRMENGWLRVDAKIARVGLQEYEDPEEPSGYHYELRPAEEVFDPESMASFDGVPYTDTHPPELLNKQNTGQYAKGHGDKVRKLDDTWIGTPILIWDAGAINSVDAGRVQISNGYNCILREPTADEMAVWGPKVPAGGRLKFTQIKIRGNHIAGVDEARAGPEARMRLDKNTLRMRALHAQVDFVPPTERRMAPQIRIGTLTINMDEANAATIQSAIEAALESAGKRSDEKTTAALARADKAEKLLKIVRDNGGRIVAKFNRVRDAFDAKKAVMAQCEECNGTGKVDGAEEGKQVSCDFCDGEGSYRMHSPIGGKAGAAEDGDEDPDGDIDEELGDKEMDADELEVEQSTEEEAGKANPKGDRARLLKRKNDRKARRDAYAEQQKALQASRQRITDRAVLRRCALQDRARKVLGDEFTFAGKTDAAIKRACVEKLNDGVKLDGKSESQIGERYDAAMERFEANGDGQSSAAVVATAPHHVVVDATGGGQGGGQQPRGRAAFLARTDAIAAGVSKGKPTEDLRKIGTKGQ